VRVIGIDENGLGPLLGPLLVTGAAFDVPGYDRETFWSLAGPDLPAGDSKQLWDRHRPAAGENAVRRWLGLFRAEAGDHAALLRSVGLAPPVPLPCAAVPPCCAPSTEPLPRWDAGGGALSLAVWDRLDRARTKPAGIRAFALCPGAFNRALEAGHGNKLCLDCELMLAVLAALTPADPGEPVLALLGKVGGARRYGQWLEAPFPGGIETLEELPEISRYRVRSTPSPRPPSLPGKGETERNSAPLPRRKGGRGVGDDARSDRADGRDVEIQFVRDGDALHLPVAVASMIGKYLRELAMDRLGAALGAGDDPPSGYRDRRTKAFVESSASRRAAIGLPDSCFLRGR
jgi:ribonuclease HII